jgi:hypothetical protein
MTALTIRLPDSALAFVQEQAAARGYATPDAYLSALITEAQERATNGKLEAELLRGLDSGPSRPMTTADWDTLRQRVRERAQAGAS